MKTLVIIILYHPDIKAVTKLIEYCLAISGVDVFLSDNSTINDETQKFFLNKSGDESGHVFYHNNMHNIGIAGAQNKGLQFGIEKKYHYSVLFDQDSDIDNDFLNTLITEFQLIRQKEANVIAVGPSFVDPRLTGRRSVKGKIDQNNYKNMIIASGCIISMADLETVGFMNEDLFIDHVDTEWCWRAKAKGYKVMQLSTVIMAHPIGEIKKLWFGYNLQYHHYFRYYYIFRNSVILCKLKTIPFKNRCYILVRNMSYILKIPFLDHKFQRVKLTLKGVWDGLNK